MKDNSITFWAHMLDECFNKSILTEGKHWPEDYIKTAVNLIKASPLGQQLWYTDNYINQDIQTFVNEFTPLSHKSSNLGFFMPIIRWFIEYSGTSKERYQEFIERKLDSIVAGLLKIRNDKSYDSRADEIKKMSFADFMKLVDEVNAKTSNVDVAVGFATTKYNVVPIYSYKELHKKYGGNKTGYKSDSEWCHTNGKSTYNSWTKNGTQMFFVIEQEGWENVKAPKQKPINCYDSYGMSLIAILVDVASNKLLKSTSRWNHVVLPTSGAADTMFETWQQLNKAVGMDVESICREGCRDLAQKLKEEIDRANETVDNILSKVKTIAGFTIPERLKEHITHIDIPSNVKSIGDDAFYACTSLQSINIPDSVTSIGNWAFCKCISLKSINIPDSVIRIRNSAFNHCDSLTSISIPNSVTSIGDGAFYNCTSLKSINIQNSVTRLGNGAFFNCESLQSINIPDSVTSIGNKVFYECKSLQSINIPDSVTHIMDKAFEYCESLTSISIPNSVMSIGDKAFDGCTSLTSVIFKGKTIDEVKRMENYPWGIRKRSTIKCQS